MTWRFCFAVAYFAALSLIQAETIEFSIKPNGKVSHEKANIVRHGDHVIQLSLIPLAT